MDININICLIHQFHFYQVIKDEYVQSYRMNYKKLMKDMIHKAGLHVDEEIPFDFSEIEKNMIYTVKPFTKTSPERIKNLMDCMIYIIKNNIQGDFVECGVWKGGSIMVILKMLIDLEVWDRNVYLYDTFEGMTEPTSEDVYSESGKLAMKEYNKTKNSDGLSNWNNSSIDEVKRNITIIGYNSKYIHFIKGKVEDTLPANAPDKIALLRLDTDWYESTKHELETLYPKLSDKGILIIDDYGYWKGAKKAVDEYFKGNQIFLMRIDSTARIAIKLDNTKHFTPNVREN